MSLLPALRSELKALIGKHHLQSVAGLIESQAAECYAMVTVGEDDYSQVGNTRFGGDPDLPPGVSWPFDSDIGYSNFFAQINFAELPPLSADTGLPKHGLLYVFLQYMECAAEPVTYDTLFYDGDLRALCRQSVPDPEALADEYMVDLIPQRIRAIPSLSLPCFRKEFSRGVRENTQEVNGDHGTTRRINLEQDLKREGQIGQLLGFANAADERDDLYRQVVLGRLDKRRLVFNDYWETMEAYEAALAAYAPTDQRGDYYRQMRPGVEWLTSNRELIAKSVEEWRLLLQLESNQPMNLWIADADPLYVFIRHEDLLRRNFSNVAGEITQG